MLVLAALLAGCATPVIEKPAPVGPTAPPSPVPIAMLMQSARQPRARAMSAMSTGFSVGTINPPSTNFGVATRFAVTNELGQKSIGVRIEWPYWPTNTPYSIQKSTNLVDWEGSFILSRGDDGATLEVIDQDQMEFYRIVHAFIGP